jgi:hypothetical protein
MELIRVPSLKNKNHNLVLDYYGTKVEHFFIHGWKQQATNSVNVGNFSMHR